MAREHHGPDPVVVLAHPVVIGSLAGWLVNDWVLKARFGNEITGKLSDIFAMVVFPLLIAVVAGKFSKYPLRWGLAINTVFFTAINLSGTADRFVENTLSLIVPSTLTMDPTDLAVLPVMAVASHVWRRSHADSSDARQIARRRVGRLVFAAGALTCMATSAPEETSSAPHSGSIMLTAEQPVVTMPLQYDLKGNSNPHLDVRLIVTAYGDGGEDDVPHGTVDWNATTDQLSFELTDTAWAPVHVEWRAWALGEIEDCFIWRCNAADATMTIDVPPLASKPQPDHQIELPYITSTEHSFAIISFDIDPAATAAIELPAPRNPFTATVGDRELKAGHGSRTWPIATPRSCANPCRVAIPLTYFSDPSEADQPPTFGLFGSVSNINVETPTLIETSVELVIPADEFETSDQHRKTFCLKADFPNTPTEPLITIAGAEVGFSTRNAPHMTPTKIDEQGCVAVVHRWVGSEQAAQHEQVIIAGTIRTIEADVPENLEIVIIR